MVAACQTNHQAAGAVFGHAGLQPDSKAIKTNNKGIPSSILDLAIPTGMADTFPTGLAGPARDASRRFAATRAGQRRRAELIAKSLSLPDSGPSRSRFRARFRIGTGRRCDGQSRET